MSGEIKVQAVNKFVFKNFLTPNVLRSTYEDKSYYSHITVALTDFLAKG